MLKKKDNWDSKYYKKHAQPQHLSGLAALKDYAFRGEELVLDVGCGDGTTSAKIAELVSRGRVVGIDLSPNMIEACKQHYGGIKNLEFYLMDATDFHFDQKFDLVVSFFALHWVKDQATAFKNIFQALNPGGHVIMRMAGGRRKEIDEIYDREPWKTLIKQQEWHGKTTQEYGQMLKDCGFVNVVANTELGTKIYPNMQALIDGLMVWVPNATGLPLEQAKKFASEIAETIAWGQNTPDGSVTSSTSMACIEAVRP